MEESKQDVKTPCRGWDVTLANPDKYGLIEDEDYKRYLEQWYTLKHIRYVAG